MEVGTLSHQAKSRSPIPAITARHSLFPSSHTRSAMGLPCGRLAFNVPKAASRVYHVSCDTDASDFDAPSHVEPDSPPVV